MKTIQSTLATMTLDQVERFRSSGHNWNTEYAPIVRQFLAGKPPLVDVNNRQYRVVVMPIDTSVHGSRRGAYLTFKTGVDLPVPAGYFMDFWDSNLRSFVSEEEYTEAPLQKRAEWNAQVQLDKYLPTQFYMNYARFWEVEQWTTWWNKRGINTSDEEGHWKKWLQKRGLK